jgi:hypothetical protein
MSRFKFIAIVAIALCASILCSTLPNALAQNVVQGPSDVVREFYKAMRQHRFKDAWSLTIYKPAVVDLTAEELEDLRSDFEEKAAQIPEQIQVTSEQINGNNATVYVVVPATESTPQITSQPVTLINAGGVWIIGDEANQAIVKKAGRRFFLDALISEHESDVEEFLKRLIAIQIVYSTQNKGAFGDFPSLIAAGLISKEVADPNSIGYNFHIALGADGKTYLAGAEPTHYGRTGKLSFWMDQTGALKSLDNGGKIISSPK